jgi:hypothetical protein
MVDAVATAAAVPGALVRRALMLSGDLTRTAEVALAEREEGFAASASSCSARSFRCSLPRAESMGEAVASFDRASVEWKLDGIRIQLHAADEVRVYTRNLNETARTAGDRRRRMRPRGRAGRSRRRGAVDGRRGPAACQETLAQLGSEAPPEGVVTFLFDLLAGVVGCPGPLIGACLLGSFVRWLRLGALRPRAATDTARAEEVGWRQPRLGRIEAGARCRQGGPPRDRHLGVGRAAVRAAVTNKEAAIELLLDRALKVGPCALVIDQPGSLAVCVARGRGVPVAYVPGLVMRRASELYPGEAKTDRRDSFVLARRTHARRLHWLELSDETLERLRLLGGCEDDLAHDANRAANRLCDLLLAISPALERVLGPRLDHPVARALPARYPAPTTLRAAGRRRLTPLAKRHAPRTGAGLVDEIQAALAAETVTVPAEETAGRVIRDLAEELDRLAGATGSPTRSNRCSAATLRRRS